MGWFLDLDMLSSNGNYYSISKVLNLPQLQEIVARHRPAIGKLRPFEALVMREAFSIFEREYAKDGYELRKVKVGRNEK
jgi:hypothetical protein